MKLISSSLILSLMWSGVVASFYQPPFVQLGTGPGGNVKTGRVEYGRDKPKFWVKEVGNGKCRLETPDVKIIDARQGGSEAVEFTCYHQNSDTVGNAYSQMNDAMYYASATMEMLRNYYTVNIPHLPISIYVHTTGLARAEETEIFFGDGRQKPFPADTFVTKNSVPHEIGHLITYWGSDTSSTDEAGGLNEAFSDMTAKTVLRYLLGSNYNKYTFDWAVGAGVTSLPGKVLRCMDNPTCAKAVFPGIKHVTESYGHTLHAIAGIYNKMFYTMCQKYDIYQVYGLFFAANVENFWGGSFDRAARRLLEAYDEIKRGKYKYNYPGNNELIREDDLLSALRDAGILCYRAKRDRPKCFRCDRHRASQRAEAYAAHLRQYLC